MAKYCFCVLTLLWALCITANAQNAHLQSAEDSVVEIGSATKTDPTNPNSAFSFVQHGTGFFIGDNLIITAAHVFFDASRDLPATRGIAIIARKLSTASQDYMVVAVGLKSWDLRHDLVLLQFDPKSITGTWKDFKVVPLHIDDTVPRVGDSAHVYGFYEYDRSPNNRDILSLTTHGTIAGFAFERAEAVSIDELLLQLPVLKGESGSPVMSEKGIVGVVVGFVPDSITPGSLSNAGVTRAVPARYITALLALK